jgi:rod shape-determining protein MreC
VAVRRPSRPRFVLLLLALTAGTIITLGYRSHANGWIGRVKGYASDVFSPVQRGVLDVVRPVGSFFQGAVDYGSLRRQNGQLREELGLSRRAGAAAADQQRELKALTGLENLPFAPTLGHVPAEVIDTGFSNFELTVLLNRGTGAGVQVGMPVVSGEGLVGRVVQSNRSTSTVLLAIDPSSSVGVRDGSIVGVASGQGQGSGLPVDFVFPPDRPQQNDVMVTSGLQGGIFPPGIPVGKVKSVSYHNGDPQENISLTPVVDMNSLEFVDVLRWLPAVSP